MRPLFLFFLLVGPFVPGLPAQDYAVQYTAQPALQTNVQFPVPLEGTVGTGLYLWDARTSRYLMVVAASGTPPTVEVYYVSRDDQPGPGPGPGPDPGPGPGPVPPPDDFAAAVEQLAGDEAVKVGDKTSAGVMAEVYARLAERIPAEIDSADKLITATRYARVSVFDPATLAKWEPWTAALGTWLDARTKDKTLSTMDHYKQAWVAIAAGLRRAAK